MQQEAQLGWGIHPAANRDPCNVARKKLRKRVVVALRTGVCTLLGAIGTRRALASPSTLPQASPSDAALQGWRIGSQATRPHRGFAESAAPAPPRQRRRVDVDGVVAATFGLENGGRLPHAVPLRDAVQLLVAAWDEAADWSRYESGHDPRDRGRDRGPPRDWHPPLAPRRFSPEASEIIRQYHAGLRPPPPPKPHERFGNSDEDVAR